MQQELRQRKGQELHSGARLSAYYIQGWTVTTQPGSRRDASYRWLSAAKSTTGGGRKSGRNFIWNGFFQAASPERSCRRLRLKGEVRPGSIFLSLPSRWCPMAVLCKHREAPSIGNREVHGLQGWLRSESSWMPRQRRYTFYFLFLCPFPNFLLQGCSQLYVGLYMDQCRGANWKLNNFLLALYGSRNSLILVLRLMYIFVKIVI